MKNFVFSIIAATAVTLFFVNSIAVLSTSTQAALSTETERRLDVSGLVNHPLNLTLSEIAAMPQTTVQATIYCVDFPNQVVEAGNWTGVKLGFLLEEAGASPSAMKIAFFASDGYSTDLLLETATQPDVIVAYEKDGVSLGGTLRLVVPGRWGYKWISQLTRIEIVDFDFKGKWESQGYSDDGFGESIGRPNIPNLSPVPNLTTNQENATTASPTIPNPPNSLNPSNSSITLPSEERQNSVPEAPEPQNPEPVPTVPIAAAFVASVAIAGAVFLVHLKKRN
jgi:DMSO/TMAO reductase YedYZ molybdopterin-dependent catalytic subunit